MSETAKKIQQLIKDGYNQTEIAKKLGYSQQYISKMIKEKNYFYLRTSKEKSLNPSVLDKLKFTVGILMEGRTFYEGYFDKPFEDMGRIDQATVILLQIIKEYTNDMENN